MTILIESDGFGKWLKAKREAKGLSMRALTEKAENVCSPSYIAQLETNYYVGRKGSPMQPSEEIVGKLAMALGESVNEARKAANYPYVDETAEEDIRVELLSLLKNYNHLPVRSRQFANRHFGETINFLLEIEGIKIEDVQLEAVEQTNAIEDLKMPPEKPEILSDEEAIRLGIKPIKVMKINKEAS